MDLSIIIPCYNEAGNIRALYGRLRPVLEKLNLSYDLIFIDDGSQDGTIEILREASAADPRIKLVILSRNFGKETALTAGLRYARGTAVIAMDADLQHPPELIPELLAKWHQGFEMVIAVRCSRETDPLWRNLGSKAFFTLFNMLSETKIIEGGGDFRLFDQRVVKILNELPERARFLKGLYSWVGFRQTVVPFNVEPRHDGRTSFSPLRLIRYSIDALSSFSAFPLRIWTFFGMLIIVASLTYAAFIATDVILHGKEIPGFASIVVLVVMIGGLQFLTIGVMGEYIGRIMIEVKGRPLFVVRETVGIDTTTFDSSLEN